MKTAPLSIPAARIRLRGIAEQMDDPILAAEVMAVVDAMYRRPPLRRAPPASPGMTEELAESILEYRVANPELTLSQIGWRFNVNPGRVSEVLAGDHDNRTSH